MRVAVPFVAGMLWSETEHAVKEQWPQATFYSLDPEDDYAYGDLVRELFGDLGDLVIVEQDVVPPMGAIEELFACRNSWCAHEVDLGGHFCAHTLSLVKYSTRLLDEVPNLADLALPSASSGRRRVHWRSVDSALLRVLDFNRQFVHVHRPPATHLHKYPTSQPVDHTPATPDKPA